MLVDWAELLRDGDVERLWNSLHQLISRHPGVRPLHFVTDGAAVTSYTEINADLTQELFLELFQKQRFDHYDSHDYTSQEIENELAHIEIPNLVGARLRKRYPESFRMARRVSSLLKTSSKFKRFDRLDRGAGRNRPPANGARRSRSESTPREECDDVFDDSEAPSPRARGRLVNQIYGLKKWPDRKRRVDPGRFAEALKAVPMRIRDTRVVGRTGSTQLIISNPDLERLIVDVFKAIDSPADVKTLRQLVLSKIPLQDYNVASLDAPLQSGDDSPGVGRDAADTRHTPEDLILREERHEEVARAAGEFLHSLRRAVNNNERRFDRLVQTLWHCYYDEGGKSQLEIARLLGVSDSLVSDNRKLIEYELRRLRLSAEEGSIFSESLQVLIRQRLAG